MDNETVHQYRISFAGMTTIVTAKSEQEAIKQAGLEGAPKEWQFDITQLKDPDSTISQQNES